MKELEGKHRAELKAFDDHKAKEEMKLQAFRKEQACGTPFSNSGTVAPKTGKIKVRSDDMHRKKRVCFVDHRNEMAYIASASNAPDYIAVIIRVKTPQPLREQSGEISSEQAVGYKRRGPEASLAANACESDALDVSGASCAPNDANCPGTEAVAEVSKRPRCRTRKERTHMPREDLEESHHNTNQVDGEVGGERLVGEGGDDGDAQGLAKHNQFLWAKKMGQQNEPRCGLFKQVEYYCVCVLMLLCVSSYYYIKVCILL
jgi:hypothetical protein